MKIAGIVCALACVALVSGLDETITTETNCEIDEDSQLEPIGNLHLCEPGATKMEKCNTCFCISDGSGWACTRMMCLPETYTLPYTNNSQSDQKNSTNRAEQEPDVPFSCAPNEFFMDNCSTCQCSADGLSAECVFKICLPEDVTTDSS